MKHDYIGCRTSPYYVNDCAADPSRARNGYTAARSTDDVVAIIDVSASIVDYIIRLMIGNYSTRLS